MIAALASACGREDVVLDAPLTTADAADLADGRALGDATHGEGGSCPEGGVRTCRNAGEACGDAHDCCEERCERGVCLPPTCGAPGAACTARAECCSGLCEPVPGTPNRACLGYCKRAAEPCSRAQDCCSLACLGGACAAGVCAKTGSDCTGDGDCCSGRCVAARCQLDTLLSCRPSGEDCNSGGGVGCCATCNADQRCDLGAGACRVIGAPCVTTGDCCRGACARVGQGPLVCTAPCIGEGAGCATTAECCAGSCSGAPATCRAQPATCSLLGVDCATDAECCSGQCLEGRCGDNCSGPR
jgi:hypothetical protein